MARILCPSLVGREPETSRIDGALDAAERGDGRVVVVSGPAGIGKSRLALETADRARARGFTVLQGRCVPASVPVPYRPLAEALMSAGRASDPPQTPVPRVFVPALRTVVPEWAPRTTEDTSVAAASPLVVSEALLRSFRDAAGTAVLLLVEDVHWADPETLHALEYLADHIAASPLVCLATLRTDERHEANALVTRLDSRRAIDLLTLGPLDGGEVAEMALRSLGAVSLDPSVETMLHERAEGNPLLVEDLLAAAVTTGSLVREGKGWHVTGELRLLVPETFATTVRSRLHATGEPGRRVLGVAALLGRAFDWRLAMRAAGLEEGAMRQVLETSVALQLLVGQDSGYAFRHALTRDAILRELLPHEREELAALGLWALERSTTADVAWRHAAADLAEVAGDAEAASRHLLEAGRAALDAGALATARAALSRAAGLASAGDVRADILEALTRTAAASGDLRETRAATDALAVTLAAIGAGAARRVEAQLELARCAIGATHLDVAGVALERAREGAAEVSDVAVEARIDAVAASFAIASLRPDDAERLARRAASAADATQQPAVLCEALEVAGRCARIRDLDEARRICQRMLGVADTAALPVWRVRALYQLGVLELFSRSDDVALREARDEALRQGALATATTISLEIAAALETQHRLDEAREVCRQCIDMAELLELREVTALAYCFLAITEATAPSGSRARLGAALARALELAGDHPEMPAALLSDAAAVASLAREDRERARSELERAVSLLSTQAAVLPRLGTALLAVVVALAGEEPDFGRCVGGTRTICQGAGYIAFAEAIAAGRVGRGDAAVAAARRGDELLANAPWYRNLMHRLAAEAALADGWGEPRVWLSEALAYFDANGNRELASACRALLRDAGVRVPRSTRAAGSLAPSLRAAGVTPREADVLALVQEGCGNREIATRLFLSERTVEQHVASLKQKLGARTRTQLAVRATEEQPTV